jgi:hypothetical protein
VPTTTNEGCSRDGARVTEKDYSATPTWKKLGITEGARVLIQGAPEGFDGELVAKGPLPPAVEFVARSTRGLDVALLFTTERSMLVRRFPALKNAIDPAGRLWIAWPKKASKVATDLDFGFVQGRGLEEGLVDNKTASITDVFQGCQFVYRLKDRPTR